jgi:hypothetical protein
MRGKPLKYRTILGATLFGLATIFLGSGCLFPEQPVYLAPGQIVELAEPVRAEVWLMNAETGKREKRRLDAEAGYYIGRMRGVE